MTQLESLPQRRKLPHLIPSWVGQGARHFITINCHQRGVDRLCIGNVATELLSSARHYEEIGHWYLWLMVVMPDHAHFIATFDLDHGLDATVKSWKGYQKRMLHIKWQAGYFEHRLRSDDEFVEKMHYVRMNPVRKELVASPDAWPHSLVRADMAPGSVSIQGGEPFIRAARQGRLALPGEEKRKVEIADV